MTGPVRKRLPNRRIDVITDMLLDPQGETGLCCTINVGMAEDLAPREIFAHPEREESVLGRLANDALTVVSVALQFGVPVEALAASVARTADKKRISIVGSAIDFAIKVGSEVAVVKGAAE